ncbi:hypothetical protein KAT55_04145, partial [Candidatus Bathyarchaeota archaeon]|nr:hypothetical protein [Candidatus Bathyarchaeota archaeon]
EGESGNTRERKPKIIQVNTLRIFFNFISSLVTCYPIFRAFGEESVKRFTELTRMPLGVLSSSSVSHRSLAHHILIV